MTREFGNVPPDLSDASNLCVSPRRNSGLTLRSALHAGRCDRCSYQPQCTSALSGAAHAQEVRQPRRRTRARRRNVPHGPKLLAGGRHGPPATIVLEDEAMKSLGHALAISLALFASAAAAQTTAPNANSAPNAQNSGAGVAGQPGNKNGPAARPGDTVGASSGTQPNSAAQPQDTSNIKGLPGNKSGPAAKQPSGK